MEYVVDAPPEVREPLAPRHPARHPANTSAAKMKRNKEADLKTRMLHS